VDVEGTAAASRLAEREIGHAPPAGQRLDIRVSHSSAGIFRLLVRMARRLVRKNWSIVAPTAPVTVRSHATKKHSHDSVNNAEAALR